MSGYSLIENELLCDAHLVVYVDFCRQGWSYLQTFLKGTQGARSFGNTCMLHFMSKRTSHPATYGKKTSHPVSCTSSMKAKCSQYYVDGTPSANPS